VDPIVPSPAQVDRAASMLAAAEMPVIHAGSGVIHAGACDELRRVAELLHAPVTTSWAARGALPETSELAIPMPFIPLNNEVRNDADLVLTVGSRLGETDWWGKAPYWRHPSEQQMIQVDVDGHVLGANKPVELAVLADARLFLASLAERLADLTGRMNLEARRRKVARYREKAREERAKLDERLADMATPMNPAHVAHACQQVFPEDAVLVADGGNAAVWARRFTESRVPNRILSTFKMGMLGAGVAQATVAAVARPEQPVCCIIGDGAMGFHPQEVETAVRNGLRVVYLVLCDRQWGMVKMNQQFALKPLKTLIRKSLGPDETIKADLGEIRFDDLGRAMGAHGERVADPRELKPAIERALASGGPAVIHVDVDPVKHMWAPGLMHFKDMHLEPKGR
jgi:acetolactate synthase-1/2/3 large subunit